MQRSEDLRGNDNWEKRPQNFNIAFLSHTVDHRNLKLVTVVICDTGFQKKYILVTFHEGQRSSGATIPEKKGNFAEKHTFFQPLW